MKHTVRNSTQLGVALRSLRKEAGLSQDDIYDKSGILQKTVSLLESGNSQSTIASLFKILAAIDCDLIIVPKKETEQKSGGEW